MLTAFVASCLVRLVTISMGIGEEDPWTYRFFPSEVALFLLGACSHQFVLPAYRKWGTATLSRIAPAAVAVLVVFTSVFTRLHFSEALKLAILFSLFFVVLPLAFIFQQRHSWDTWLANLSYPTYVVHWLVIEWLGSTAWFASVPKVSIKGLIVCACSVAAAMALNYAVGQPFEKLRDRFRSRHGHRPESNGDRIPVAASHTLAPTTGY